MELLPSVLMVVTSHDRLDDDRATGLWLEEFAVPYGEFRRAGLNVTVASPKGCAAPIDPRSSPKPGQARDWREAIEALRGTVLLEEVNGAEHHLLFLPGGHGAMFDLPDVLHLQQVIGHMADRGCVIAAVCHGPAALVNVSRLDGSPLVEGVALTAFTDAEERETGLADKLPFLLESRLRERGARFAVAPNWADHVEVDSRLVTGQNPQSAATAAHAALRLIGIEERRFAA